MKDQDTFQIKDGVVTLSNPTADGIKIAARTFHQAAKLDPRIMIKGSFPAAACRVKIRGLVVDFDGQTAEVVKVVAPCPKCGAQAVIKLPDMILAQQPDSTTHVCHPVPGGCNHGFSLDQVTA